MMKTKSFAFQTLFLFTLVIFLFMLGCSEEPTEIKLNDEFIADESFEINQVLAGIESGANILVVEQNSSIQEAINEAVAGTYILIEPGVYYESLNIDKSAIKLIGLNNEEDGVVIKNPETFKTAIHIEGDSNAEFSNIKFEGFDLSKINLTTYRCREKGGNKLLRNFSRVELGKGIAHYQYELQMGPGAYDVINVHRVVREYRPYHPVKTSGNVFMVHGAIQDFDDIFLSAGAEEINAETSAPYYLADKDIDVWGIDLSWTRVPLETEDFEFMRDWGLERDIDHTLFAMTLARAIRGFTKHGCDKMNLLGFSYGVYVAYGAAGREIKMNPHFRNVKGLIPVDLEMKSENESFIIASCTAAQKQLLLYENGSSYNPYGLALIPFGELALDAPDDPSPYFPGLTNIQAVMVIGSDNSDNWHFFGGTPFEYYYTDPMRFARLCANLSPYMPRLVFYEINACGCPSEDVSFDDNIAKIKLPIFTITSEGGDGPYGDYTSSLTKSKDITWLNVNDPERERQYDFGHGDLWLSFKAADWMWNDLYQWLLSH